MTARDVLEMSQLIDILLHIGIPLKQAKGIYKELKALDVTEKPHTRKFLQTLGELREVTEEK